MNPILWFRTRNKLEWNQRDIFRKLEEKIVSSGVKAFKNYPVLCCGLHLLDSLSLGCLWVDTTPSAAHFNVQLTSYLHGISEIRLYL